MNISRAALGLYTVSVAALGGLLLTSHFVFVWAPLPRALAAGPALERAAGAVMLAAAVGLAWRRTRVAAAAIVTALFGFWLALVQVPRLISAPSREVLWSGAAQLVAIAAAGWILFATFATVTAVAVRRERSVRIARILYALVLPVMGVHHFMDVAGTAEAVPAWLPFRAALGIGTGVAHIAAGVAILVGTSARAPRLYRLARLAAVLEAVMISGFVLLIHVPGAIGASSDELQWTMLVVAAAIGSAAWVVAASFTSAGSIAPRSRS